MVTQSSILAWRIPWTEEPGRLQSIGCKESDTTERLTYTNVTQQIRELRDSTPRLHVASRQNWYLDSPLSSTWTLTPLNDAEQSSGHSAQTRWLCLLLP